MEGWVACSLNALKQQATRGQGLNLPHTFVPQSQLRPGQAYEAFIRDTRQIPTRDNWHDLLNGLIWLHMPHSKQRLNRIQAAEIAKDGIGARRGPVRDAYTVFDENAALIFAPDALWDALVARRWEAVFTGELCALWREARVLVFGHAALEKLLTPYKSITVHLWRCHMPFEPGTRLHELDAWLAHDLQPEKLARKPFCPLPILGIPGWWPENEAPNFYQDPSVFRPARHTRAAGQTRD